MSLCGRAGNLCRRKRRPFCLMVVLLALPVSSCQPIVTHLPVRLQVEVLLDPATVGVNTLQFVWNGDWINDTDFPGSGAQVAGDTAVLTPASQTPAFNFSPSVPLRQGVWEIKLKVTSPSSTILDTYCYVDLLSENAIVRFTQNLNGCSPLMGGLAPVH